MILQALVRYYEMLLKFGQIERPGWTKENVSDKIILNGKGELTGILSVRNTVVRKNKEYSIDVKLTVPEHQGRTSGIRAYFLCDKLSYILGLIDEEKIKQKVESELSNDTNLTTAQRNDRIQRAIQKEKSQALKEFEASKQLHHKILDGSNDPVAEAILAFFDHWNPSKGFNNAIIQKNKNELLQSSNLVFQVNDSDAINQKQIQYLWIHRGEEKRELGSCLVTGKTNVPIAVTHPKVKGVKGSLQNGASIVSFNTSSLESFGHDGDQGLNAPVSEYAAFAYTTALNQLLRDGNNFPCGDTTVVFWAQSAEKLYSQIYMDFLNATGDGENRERTVQAVLKKILQGVAADVNGITLSPDEPFYVLGLSPNAARISVRFFWQNTFGVTLEHLQNHQKRLEIVRPSWEQAAFLPLWRMMRESVNPNATKKQASPLLAGSLLRSILQDTPYPEAMYRQYLLRIKADSGDGKINYPRAAFIKAYLLKNHQEKWGGKITMNVNENCNAVPYVLGRLFAVLEGLQQDSSEVNATIKDRYFNAACATPGAVFPVLLKLANAHLNKLSRKNKGIAVNIQKKLGTLMGKISMPDEGNPIPGRLTLDEQGMFILGYYQETQDRYTKKEEKA